MVEKVIENNKLVTEYDITAGDLMTWIQVTTVTLQERDFANTLVGVQQQMIEFNQYRTQEKPPRYCMGSTSLTVDAIKLRSTIHVSYYTVL